MIFDLISFGEPNLIEGFLADIISQNSHRLLFILYMFNHSTD